MTIETETVVLSGNPAGTEERHSYVDWPAIIGGIALASAISLVLLAFGSAVGLSFADFQAGPDVNPIWIAIAAALGTDLELHAGWLRHRAHAAAPPRRHRA